MSAAQRDWLRRASSEHLRGRALSTPRCCTGGRASQGRCHPHLWPHAAQVQMSSVRQHPRQSVHGGASRYTASLAGIPNCALCVRCAQQRGTWIPRESKFDEAGMFHLSQTGSALLAQHAWPIRGNFW